jgi:hypothetical protein
VSLGEESDSPWTFKEVKAAYHGSVQGILETVRAVWRLRRFEEQGEGDETWIAQMTAWLVSRVEPSVAMHYSSHSQIRHDEVCRERGVKPYPPVVEYTRSAVERQIFDTEELPTEEVPAPETPRPQLSPPPDVLIVERSLKRKQPTLTSSSDSIVSDSDVATKDSDEEWIKPDGVPPTAARRTTSGSKAQIDRRALHSAVKECKGNEKNEIRTDLRGMTIVEDTELPKEVKKLFPQVRIAS